MTCLVSVFFWVLSHLLAALSAIFCRNFGPVFLISFVFLFVSYLIKTDTFDLVVYSEYFKNPSGYEILFLNVSRLLSSFRFEPDAIKFFWQLVIVCLCLIAVRCLFSEIRLNKILFLLLSTPFFFLGSQNVLRQGVSCSLALVGFSLLLKKRHKILAFMLLVASVFIHFYTGLIFLLFILPMMFIVANIICTKEIFFLAGIFLGIIITLTVELSFSAFVYFNNEVSWGAARSDSLTRLLGVSLVFFLISSLPFSQPSSVALVRLMKTRIFFFGFCVSLIKYPEVFSRLTFIGYGFDFIMLCAFWGEPPVKFEERLKFAVVLVAYGFAPNIIRVLLG